MKNIPAAYCIILLLTCGVGNAGADEDWGGKLSSMVKGGTASVDFRYRYEGVDEAGFDQNAKASTLRTRLTLASASLNNFSALLEMDDVRTIGWDDYNSTTNGKSPFPVVADPVGTDLNQFWFKYRVDEFDTTLGRQRILLGNQRFVGGAAFRQNEQTFDGLRAQVMPTDKLVLDLSYVSQINRIFGPEDGANPATLTGDNVFFRADYRASEAHRLSGYGYWLRIDPQSGYTSGKTVDNSSNSLGLEYKGQFDKLSLAAAWARQSDAGDSTLDYEADYYMVELVLGLQTVKLKAGYEVLGSDNGVGFATPLATLHKFQGWADKFLDTPGDGLKDTYLDVSGNIGAVKLGAVYHDFQAEATSAKFGSEIDLVASWTVNKQFSVEAKYANFNSDDSSRFSDAKKGWVTLKLKL
ncbi:MAG: alginate export family protein [Gammaproteobacteria bacterium]|nr:alginate export family protein [Gammaproteobacteria bacterium]